MELMQYLATVRNDLAGVAEAGGAEARAVAERLVAPLESSLRLVLLDALSAAADEISRDLAPGSVELRLRGRDPGFVVTPAPTGSGAEDQQPDDVPPPRVEPGDDGATARINLRLGEQLKAQIEVAASESGLSVNAWLVRVAASSLSGAGQPDRRQPPGRGRGFALGGQSYRGWVR